MAAKILPKTPQNKERKPIHQWLADREEQQVILTLDEYETIFDVSGALEELPDIGESDGKTFPHFLLKILSGRLISVLEPIQDRNAEVLRGENGGTE